MDVASRLPLRCPICTSHRRLGLFDVAVRPGGEPREQLFFGIPASLCRRCGDFRIDPELALLVDIDDSVVVSAIASDSELWTPGAA